METKIVIYQTNKMNVNKKMVSRIKQGEIKDNKQNKPNETTSSKQNMYMAWVQPNLLKLVFEDLAFEKNIINPPIKRLQMIRV